MFSRKPIKLNTTKTTHINEGFICRMKTTFDYTLPEKVLKMNNNDLHEYQLNWTDFWLNLFLSFYQCLIGVKNIRYIECVSSIDYEPVRLAQSNNDYIHIINIPLLNKLLFDRKENYNCVSEDDDCIYLEPNKELNPKKTEEEEEDNDTYIIDGVIDFDTLLKKTAQFTDSNENKMNLPKNIMFMLIMLYVAAEHAAEHYILETTTTNPNYQHDESIETHSLRTSFIIKKINF